MRKIVTITIIAAGLTWLLRPTPSTDVNVYIAFPDKTSIGSWSCEEENEAVSCELDIELDDMQGEYITLCVAYPDGQRCATVSPGGSPITRK